MYREERQGMAQQEDFEDCLLVLSVTRGTKRIKFVLAMQLSKEYLCPPPMHVVES